MDANRADYLCSACPGMNLANAQIYLFMAQVISLFEIRPPLDETNVEKMPPVEYMNTFIRSVEVSRRRSCHCMHFRLLTNPSEQFSKTIFVSLCSPQNGHCQSDVLVHLVWRPFLSSARASKISSNAEIYNLYFCFLHRTKRQPL